MFDVHVKHVQLLYMFGSVKHVQKTCTLWNLYMFVTCLTCTPNMYINFRMQMYVFS